MDGYIIMTTSEMRDVMELRLKGGKDMVDKGITVKQLLKACQKEITKGNGDKHILISCDDEGNGYHTLFYGLDCSKEIIRYALMVEHDKHTEDEIIILG